MSRILGVIPARMAASRFPGKPLARLAGRPMLQHVFERSRLCPDLDALVVATCDIEIAQAVRGFGAEVVMTSPLHERATDRVAEVGAADDAEIVVMIQGDEPMIVAEMISTAVRPLLQNPAIACTNLLAPIGSAAELVDRNTIKVVTAADRRALYFSRQPIPFSPSDAVVPRSHFKQVCVIAFRREALARFHALPQGPLERSESIDMLRFLENGIDVHMVPTAARTYSVDTPDDLRRVERLLQVEATRT
jgi:3-deoxy-manno-octulosonate cytidylyltransferase (CMP-KDO synthetase)